MKIWGTSNVHNYLLAILYYRPNVPTVKTVGYYLLTAKADLALPELARWKQQLTFPLPHNQSFQAPL